MVKKSDTKRNKMKHFRGAHRQAGRGQPLIKKLSPSNSANSGHAKKAISQSSCAAPHAKKGAALRGVLRSNPAKGESGCIMLSCAALLRLRCRSGRRADLPRVLRRLQTLMETAVGGFHTHKAFLQRGIPHCTELLSDSHKNERAAPVCIHDIHEVYMRVKVHVYQIKRVSAAVLLLVYMVYITFHNVW